MVRVGRHVVSKRSYVIPEDSYQELQSDIVWINILLGQKPLTTTTRSVRGFVGVSTPTTCSGPPLTLLVV